MLLGLSIRSVYTLTSKSKSGDCIQFWIPCHIRLQKQELNFAQSPAKVAETTSAHRSKSIPIRPPKMDGHWMEGKANFQNGIVQHLSVNKATLVQCKCEVSYKAIISCSTASYLDAGLSCERSATVSVGTNGEPTSASLLTSWDECDVDVLH